MSTDGNVPCVVRLNARTLPLSDEERSILAGIPARVVETEGATDDEILAVARDADAIMIISAYLHTPVVRALTRCRVISRIGTGVDKIDVEEATRRGILVTNVPDFSTDEVADHTLALLLAVARRIKFLDLEMRRGRQPREVWTMHRLSAQTVGLVGFGRIGQAVARRCKGFGLRVLAHDPRMTPELAAREGVAAVDFDTVLQESDYLCLLCPLLPATRGMMAMPQFRKMKRTAVLVNTGRGELVNEADLVIALRDGIIRGAALDVFGGINVFGENGFPTDHPLFSLDNVLLTPHMAAASVESGQDVRRRGAIAVADVLGGKWPKYPVNPEVAPWYAIARPT